MDSRTAGGAGVGRSQFFKRTLLVGGAAVAGGVLSGSPTGTRAAPAGADQRALDLLLLVEYTESAFYSEALKRGALKGAVQRYAREVAAQEREHLAFVKKALGSGAARRPDFHFGDATGDNAGFARAAAQLEDLAVAAYNGQAPNVSPGTLAAAATVVSVEARHAAWIRSIVGEPPAPDATDTPKSAKQVLDGLTALGLRR